MEEGSRDTTDPVGHKSLLYRGEMREATLDTVACYEASEAALGEVARSEKWEEVVAVVDDGKGPIAG